MDGWFDELYGTSRHMLEVVVGALAFAAAWAKEWQVLLAGLLVFLAAIIVARAIVKTGAIRPVHAASGRKQTKPDLRQAAKPASAGPQVVPPQVAPQDASQELVGNLEQLRSLIRSALSSFTLTTEKENSPASFLCQRITHLRLEQIPPSAAKPAREAHAALLLQLETLRGQLKKDAPAAEISETLVQMNTSARNVVAALAPASDQPRQAVSEQR